MNAPFHANLLCAWIGILLGFLSGLVFGLFFHRENWLGGYGSFKRRKYGSPRTLAAIPNAAKSSWA